MSEPIKVLIIRLEIGKGVIVRLGKRPYPPDPDSLNRLLSVVRAGIKVI